MDAGAELLLLDSTDAAGTAAGVAGPAFNGNASIVLPFTRPIQFDRISCTGTGTVAVGWVGNEP
jgi:hypothetical protein